MASYSKLKLSGSTDGKGIKVGATAIGSGTTIHTAHATALDVLDLYAVNSDTVSHKLTLGWGGTTAPDDLIEIYLEPEAGLVPLTIKLPLTNSLIAKAACDTADMVIIHGSVSRIA